MTPNIIYTPANWDELENRLIERIKREISTPSTLPTVEAKDTDLLTVQQTATLLGVSKVTIHKWKQAGTIPFLRYGTRIRIRKSDITNLKKYKGGTI